MTLWLGAKYHQCIAYETLGNFRAMRNDLNT